MKYGHDRLDDQFNNQFILKSTRQIGSLIKNIRKEMNVTQDELAHFSGLSRVGVVKIEKEESDIKLSTLIKVANLLGFEIVLTKRSNK